MLKRKSSIRKPKPVNTWRSLSGCKPGLC